MLARLRAFQEPINFVLKKRRFINIISSLLFIVVLLSSSNPTGSPGGNKTDLATGGGTSLDSRGLTDVLMVTTTVRMLNGVHSNTTNLGPAVTLDLVFVVGTTSLQDGFVDTSTAGNDSNHGAVGRGNNLLNAFVRNLSVM